MFPRICRDIAVENIVSIWFAQVPCAGCRIGRPERQLLNMFRGTTRMAECVCLPGCPFFNDQMKDMEGMANIYKRKYCLGDSSECARHMVFETLGKEAVPSDLYPNMRERAGKIMRNGAGAG